MGLNRAQVFKLVGLAGVVGVAATGVLVARNERQRRAYSADEIREQLHARYARTAHHEPVAKHAKVTPMQRLCARIRTARANRQNTLARMRYTL